MAIAYGIMFGLGDFLLMINLYLLLALSTQLQRAEHRLALLAHPSRHGNVVPMQPMPKVDASLIKGQTATDALAAIRVAQAYVRRRYGRKEGL